MATTSQRQEQFRQGRLAAGYRREAFWLEPQALSALERLRSLRPGTTRDRIVSNALTGLLEHNKPLSSNSGQAPLETNRVLATNRPLEHNAVLETNRNAPVDRAELAAIAREWRCEGLTLEQVATRLNDRGWTPSAIPAKRTTGDSWSGKSIAQLLNRDCKSD